MVLKSKCKIFNYPCPSNRNLSFPFPEKAACMAANTTPGGCLASTAVWMPFLL